MEGLEPVWHDDDDWKGAETAFWYRKFYTETKTGQLMVLRPDKPTLYYFERPQTRDAVGEMQLVTLAKTYRLVLAALPLLVATVFPSIKEYAALVAAYFGAKYLLLCWRTRKIGEE